MPAAPADSAIFRDLFGDAETAALFSTGQTSRDAAGPKGALARVQGALGLIPAEPHLHRTRVP